MRRQKKKRYSKQFAMEVVRDHVEFGMSYRKIAKRSYERYGVRVSPSTLQGMVVEIGKRCKTPYEMSHELCLKRLLGYLLVDDKRISVGGKKVRWYFGLDKTGDILHAEMMKEYNVSNMVAFFKVIRDGLHYKLKGLTTDQEILFSLAHDKVFAGKPHQTCIKHVFESLDRYLGYTSKVGTLKRLKIKFRERFRMMPDCVNEESHRRRMEEVRHGIERIKVLKEELAPVEQLRKDIHRVLRSRTYALACSRWANFNRHRLRHHRTHKLIVEFVKKRWHTLTVHYHHRGMPATNNIAENFMRQLEKRLKTIEGFGNVKTAESYIKLLIACLRTKPLTDCKGKRKFRNGSSRLELAGALLPSKDWLKLCLKSP
jgi:transposase-like protein